MFYRDFRAAIAIHDSAIFHYLGFRTITYFSALSPLLRALLADDGS